jgi:hypothetical protein
MWTKTQPGWAFLESPREQSQLTCTHLNGNPQLCDDLTHVSAWVLNRAVRRRLMLGTQETSHVINYSGQEINSDRWKRGNGERSRDEGQSLVEESGQASDLASGFCAQQPPTLRPNRCASFSRRRRPPPAGYERTS